MADEIFFTAAHIRYLLTLKKLHKESGIKSTDIAKALGLTKASVHNMMNTFLSMDYIKKEHGWLVFLTEHGLEKASLYEIYHSKLKEKLFSDKSTDHTADMAIYAFLAELSDQSLDALTREVQFFENEVLS